MTALPNEIFIVDSQLKSDIRDNPHYEDLASGFELVEIGEIKKSNGLKVEDGSREVDLSAYNKKGHLVQSEIYLNRYYPLFDYVKNAHHELGALMNLLCNFMGDNVKFECEICEERLYIVQSNNTLNVSGGGKSKALEGSATYNSKESQHTSSENWRQITFGAEVSNAKKTPKELNDYIEQKHINLHALPPSFRILVETYLDSPNAKLKGYESQIDTLAQASKYVQKCKNFCGKASYLGIFKADFGVDFSGEENGFLKVKTKIRHSVKFE